jgi:hypothetical protein
MAGKNINLHGIAAEIDKVQEQLRAAKLEAAPSDVEYLDLKIAALQDLHYATHQLCPKAWGVWGEPSALEAAPVKRGPAHALPARRADS